jgi:hypothetical protein
MWFFVPSMAGFVASPSGIIFFVPTWHGCSDYRRCGWKPVLLEAVTFFDAKVHRFADTFFDAKDHNSCRYFL